MSNEQKTKF